MNRVACVLTALALGLSGLRGMARAQDMPGMPGMNMSGTTAPAATATAPAITGPVPGVTIKQEAEDHKPVLVATVTLKDGAKDVPLEGAKVDFYVQRSFGLLAIGQDVTLDDGTAAVPYPAGLPGADGKLDVVVRVEPKDKRVHPEDLKEKVWATAVGKTTISSDTVILPNPDPFPRALWSPRAPIPLVATLAILLGGVWCTYVFVVSRLLAIRRLGKQRES